MEQIRQQTVLWGLVRILLGFCMIRFWYWIHASIELPWLFMPVSWILTVCFWLGIVVFLFDVKIQESRSWKEARENWGTLIDKF